MLRKQVSSLSKMLNVVLLSDQLVHQIQLCFRINLIDVIQNIDDLHDILLELLDALAGRLDLLLDEERSLGLELAFLRRVALRGVARPQ